MTQVSDRNLHEEWLNDTPEEEAAFWDGLKKFLVGSAQQHAEWDSAEHPRAEDGRFGHGNVAIGDHVRANIGLFSGVVTDVPKPGWLIVKGDHDGKEVKRQARDLTVQHVDDASVSVSASANDGTVTPEQHKALSGYQDDYTSSINHGLRTGLPPTEVVTNIDAAIAAQPPITKPLILWRAVGADVLTKIGKDGTFVDKGYSSTTHSRDTAEEYAGEEVSVNGNHWSGRLVQIYVPAGAHVFDYDNHPQFGSDNINAGMGEVLLPRGSRFKHEYVGGLDTLRLLL